MDKILREITFFYTDGVEKQTTWLISVEARKRGYIINHTDNILDKADIGIYCQHSCIPSNSKFSIILLHDFGQGHNRWPNIWKFEPWSDFDIGILPGKSWVDRWQECSNYSYSRPRLGVYELGWPKADILFKKEHSESAQKEIKILKEGLNLMHPITVLYAPSWENDRKQDEFVQALKDLPVNLLLKQAPWSDEYPEIIQNIKEMDDLHKNYKDNVNIISPKVDIMLCLKLCDIVVSDESSVLIEGLALDIPAVAVTDWMIPDCSPPRSPSIPFDFVTKTTKIKLNETIAYMLENFEKYHKEILFEKEKYFSCLGCSSTSIMDLIDYFAINKGDAIKPVLPTKRRESPSMKWFIKNYLNHQKIIIKGSLKKWRGFLKSLFLS